MLFFLSCDFSPIVERQLNRANKAVEDQSFQEAVDIYNYVLASTSSNKIKVRVLIQMAQIHAYHLNKVEISVKLIKKAITLTNDPNRLIKLNEILGDIYYSDLRIFSEASKMYGELIEVKPRLANYFEYRYRHAESLFLANKFSLSLNNFESLIEEFPDKYKSKIYFRVALINYFLRNTELAIQKFKEIIEGDFNYSEKIKASFYLAGIFENSNQLKKAYKYYSLIKYDYPNTALINQKINSIKKRLTENGL